MWIGGSQPSDAEIAATASVVVEHFQGDLDAAAIWLRGEAIRFLRAGDLRRNLIAVRLYRFIKPQLMQQNRAQKAYKET